MIERQNRICEERESGLDAKADRMQRAVRYAAGLVLLGSFSLVAGFETARKALPAPSLDSSVLAQNSSVSPVRMPTSEKDGDTDFSQLPAQQQAERLLERAMNDDAASLNLLRQNVDGWRGHLKNTDRLFDLVLAALNSRDLRVRTAAVDVDLAANNLSKSPESVARLIQQL